MRDFFVGRGSEGEIFWKKCSFPGEGYIGGESGDSSKIGPDKAAISLAAVGIDSFHPFWNKHVYRERTRWRQGVPGDVQSGGAGCGAVGEGVKGGRAQVRRVDRQTSWWFLFVADKNDSSCHHGLSVEKRERRCGPGIEKSVWPERDEIRDLFIPFRSEHFLLRGLSPVQRVFRETTDRIINRVRENRWNLVGWDEWGRHWREKTGVWLGIDIENDS